MVCEGVPDWLAWSTRFSDSAEEVPAVLGIVSGSWDDSLGRRLEMVGTLDLLIRTHDDAQGKSTQRRF